MSDKQSQNEQPDNQSKSLKQIAEEALRDAPEPAPVEATAERRAAPARRVSSRRAQVGGANKAQAAPRSGTTQTKAGGHGAWLGFVAGLLVAGALGAVLLLGRHDQQAPRESVEDSSKEAVQPKANDMAPTAEPETTPAATADQAAKPDTAEHGLSVDSLPEEGVSEGAEQTGREPSATAPPRQRKAPGQTTTESPPKSSSGTASTKQASGGPVATAAEPAQAGPLPTEPSLGAVQAAIGANLGRARRCLAGQLQPSKARLTFTSDGSVSAVTVSGPAAGTAAEPCVVAALKRARVEPFRRASFSVDTTVRP